jgi:hypothetical protein
MKLAILRPQLYKKFDVLNISGNPFNRTTDNDILIRTNNEFTNPNLHQDLNISNIKIHNTPTDIFTTHNYLNNKINFYNNNNY